MSEYKDCERPQCKRGGCMFPQDCPEKGSLASSDCSAEADGCLGCQWRKKITGQWCDMFGDKPEDLPCAQHDKYAPIRAAAIQCGKTTFMMRSVGLLLQAEQNTNADGRDSDSSS